MSIKYECVKNVSIVEIDNEWIVMDTEKFMITKLNDIGAHILEEIREQKEIKDIIKNVAANYDIDLNIARSDVLIFLEELKQVGLIQNGRV